MMYSLKRLFNPEIFQGRYKRRNYFEGWYYKIIDREMKSAYAVIPGISCGEREQDSHAFIQVLNANKCSVEYVSFDISDFKYSRDRFEISIGNNYFTNDEIRLNIAQNHFRMDGRLAFNNIIAYPKTFLRPGIMGPFSFVPFMECRHGIVNVHHEIKGRLNISGSEVDFDGGYGYIEKDWGTSFPESWVWLQSNHFGRDDVTVMFSVAKIPWLGSFFTGLISFIRIKEKIYLFATYNGSTITRLEYTGNRLMIAVEGKEHKFEATVWHTDGGILKAPKNGLMQSEISESITAEVAVRLSDMRGVTVYEGKGSHTGLEIANDLIYTYLR